MKRTAENYLSDSGVGRGENYEQGYQQGLRWAKTKASYFELDRLARLGHSIDDDWSNWLKGEGRVATLAREVGALDSRDRAAEESFWSDTVGSGYAQLTESVEYVRGFVDGSLEIYEQVAIHLGHS
jgi:hypothetical protein